MLGNVSRKKGFEHTKAEVGMFICTETELNCIYVVKLVTECTV